MKNASALDAQDLNSVFCINELDGLIVSTKTGRTVGCKTSDGYIVVKANARQYYAHRVAYALYFGCLPEGAQIDHINGNRSDNRKSNLRLATHKQNMENRKVQKNNKSGFRGVTWDAERNSWQAHISNGGKFIRLGRFATAEDASKAYESASSTLYTHHRLTAP